MNYTAWFEIAPSILSAIATAAAAFAAFSSLKISRESKMVAERSALAIQHGEAAKTLTTTLENLSRELSDFSEIAYDLHSSWPREIEEFDCRSAGGLNPRPLRHVLINAGEMLERHATKNGVNYNHTHRAMFHTIRNGMGEFSETEFENLLQRVDGTYAEFEEVLGKPLSNKPINNSSAFRWAHYQLERRLTTENWRTIWRKAWTENGYLSNYRREYEKVLPALRESFVSIKREKDLLAHSVYPLEANLELFNKYKWTLEILQSLIESDYLDLIEYYIGGADDEDLVQLVVYSVGVSLLKRRAIEALLYDRPF